MQNGCYRGRGLGGRVVVVGGGVGGGGGTAIRSQPVTR